MRTTTTLVDGKFKKFEMYETLTLFSLNGWKNMTSDLEKRIPKPF